MGIQDRDYINPNRGIGSTHSRKNGNSMFSRAPGWTVTTWIIVVNIAVHVLATIVFRSPTLNPMGGAFYHFGALTVYDAFQRLEVWRLITFQFLHDPGTITHILFNMFGLWVFGPMVEQYLGARKYLAFYLICGLSGGLLFILLNLLGALTPLHILADGFKSPLIGASAGVFGVIIACAYVSPHSVIQLLFPPIPMKMRTFAYGYVAIALFSLLMGSHNAGGEAAHMGGAIAGFFFIRHSHFLTDFFDVFGDSRQPRKPRKPGSSGRSRRTVHGASYRSDAPSESEIDRILEKVSQKGLGSLTDKEKKKLSEASKSRG